MRKVCLGKYIITKTFANFRALPFSRALPQRNQRFFAAFCSQKEVLSTTPDPIKSGLKAPVFRPAF
jgi:hypothetical protein